MIFNLVDGDGHKTLKPFTYTRPVSSLRWGILTIKEKWEHLLGQSVGYICPEYLSGLFPANSGSGSTVLINAGISPRVELVNSIKALDQGQALYQGETWIATHLDSIDPSKESQWVQYDAELHLLKRSWQLFQENERELHFDFSLLTAGKKTQPLSNTNRLIGTHPIFLAEGAKAECAIFNTTEGPIYLDKDSEVMEGSIIRGPFYLGEHSQVKMGAKIYGPTTIGPHSKVGGEIGNSIIQGYSNKGHEGYLGNSVIGEWCNLGADTNSSNLKNNYSKVSVYDFETNSSIDTGLQFCGLLMGDHSKCGINTMFNTGTVVGVMANIFGGGFPPKAIPSYAWGGADSAWEVFRLDKAIELAQRVKSRRNMELSQPEIDILTYLFNQTVIQAQKN